MHTPSQEEFRVNGEELLAKVKELIRAGNARRIIIKNESGEAVLEIGRASCRERV